MPDNAPVALFPQSPESYGPLHQPTLVDLYKSYVESTDRVSDRRGSANTYLLSVNTALVTLAGLVPTGWVVGRSLPLIAIAGAITCLTWIGLLASYRELNTAKFRVIEKIEQQLPVAAYSHEWSLKRESAPLSLVEQGVPLAFLAVYAGLVVLGFAA